MPVVDGEQLVGIITQSDMVAARCSPWPCNRRQVAEAHA
jgi:CBS-domain-containing membrane protein